MSKDRTYSGESDSGSLQDAISEALQKLEAALGEDGVRDASASWILAEVSGTYGGIANFNKVKAKIIAKRSPDW